MKPDKPRVLVVDDGQTYARVVKERIGEVSLVRPNSRALCIGDGPAALRFLQKKAQQVDLVLLDMRFDLPTERLLPVPGKPSARNQRRYQGVAILKAIRSRWPRLPVVLLTAEQDLSLLDADGSMGAESMTYFLDGDDLDSLRISIHRALAQGQLRLQEADVLWGRDGAMASLRRRLSVMARGRMPLILEGETGTGKSYLAERFVHRNSGRKGPFVVLDLSTVPSELVSAHLFGAVKGAFTGAIADRKGVFEAAHGGTLFIDEIQNAPLEVQKQLLLVLQDRKLRRIGSTQDVEVDVKVVAASNQSLALAVQQGRFRADLHMRLSPATRVRIPPLRERPEDLRFFATRFVSQAGSDPDLSPLRAQIAQAAGLPADTPLALNLGDAASSDAALTLGLAPPSWQRLEAHTWPGNLRELSMVMQNLVSFTLVGAVDAMQDGTPVRAKRLQIDPGLVGELLDLPEGQSSALAVGASPALPEGAVAVQVEAGKTLNAVAQDVERQYLLALFREHGGDFQKLAQILLDDPDRARAVRLRFNQLGLKIRELRQA